MTWPPPSRIRRCRARFSAGTWGTRRSRVHELLHGSVINRPSVTPGPWKSTCCAAARARADSRAPPSGTVAPCPTAGATSPGGIRPCVRGPERRLVRAGPLHAAVAWPARCSLLSSRSPVSRARRGRPAAVATVVVSCSRTSSSPRHCTAFASTGSSTSSLSSPMWRCRDGGCAGRRARRQGLRLGTRSGDRCQSGPPVANTVVVAPRAIDPCPARAQGFRPACRRPAPQCRWPMGGGGLVGRAVPDRPRTQRMRWSSLTVRCWPSSRAAPLESTPVNSRRSSTGCTSEERTQLERLNRHRGAHRTDADGSRCETASVRRAVPGGARQADHIGHDLVEFEILRRVDGGHALAPEDLGVVGGMMRPRSRRRRRRPLAGGRALRGRARGASLKGSRAQRCRRPRRAQLPRSARVSAGCPGR